MLSLTLAGVMPALGIVLQQLLHKKEVKWVTESSGVMVLGATFNAAYYLVQKLLGSEHHMSISISPLMHDVSASAQFCATLRNSLTAASPPLR